MVMRGQEWRAWLERGRSYGKALGDLRPRHDHRFCCFCRGEDSAAPREGRGLCASDRPRPRNRPLMVFDKSAPSLTTGLPGSILKMQDGTHQSASPSSRGRPHFVPKDLRPRRRRPPGHREHRDRHSRYRPHRPGYPNRPNGRDGPRSHVEARSPLAAGRAEACRGVAVRGAHPLRGARRLVRLQAGR